MPAPDPLELYLDGLAAEIALIDGGGDWFNDLTGGGDPTEAATIFHGYLDMLGTQSRYPLIGLILHEESDGITSAIAAHGGSRQSETAMIQIQAEQKLTTAELRPGNVLSPAIAAQYGIRMAHDLSNAAYKTDGHLYPAVTYGGFRFRVTVTGKRWYHTQQDQDRISTDLFLSVGYRHLLKDRSQP